MGRRAQVLVLDTLAPQAIAEALVDEASIRHQPRSGAAMPSAGPARPRSKSGRS
jgi:hypothetical protein